MILLWWSWGSFLIGFGSASVLVILFSIGLFNKLFDVTIGRLIDKFFDNIF